MTNSQILSRTNRREIDLNIAHRYQKYCVFSTHRVPPLYATAASTESIAAIKEADEMICDSY